MMSTTAQQPATTPIPVQLSEPEFIAFILPHLSMPKRGPKCKLGYYRVCNLIVWVLYTGMQWKCLRTPSLLGQTPDPLALLERVKARHAPVRDFYAEVAIAVDVDFLRVPVKSAQVFYQQPDTWTFKDK